MTAEEKDKEEWTKIEARYLNKTKGAEKRKGEEAPLKKDSNL